MGSAVATNAILDHTQSSQPVRPAQSLGRTQAHAAVGCLMLRWCNGLCLLHLMLEFKSDRLVPQVSTWHWDESRGSVCSC